MFPNAVPLGREPAKYLSLWVCGGLPPASSPQTTTTPEASAKEVVVAGVPATEGDAYCMPPGAPG